MSAPIEAEPEARAAERNAALLAGQLGLDLARALAFVALVPRSLGPADFGRFALLSSLALWFSLLSGLGSTQMLGRFVPTLAPSGESGARRLLGNLLAVRLLGGTASALLYLLLTALLLRELPVALPALMAAAIVLRNVANVPFAYFLGLNKAARWGAGELVRRWAALLFVVPGVLFFGLTGACLGFLLAESIVLALGLAWIRPYVSLAEVRLEPRFFAPFLRFNLLFFGSNLLFALCQRAGETLVRLFSGDSAEVGYFGLAAAAYLAGSHAVRQLVMAFVPLLSRARAEGRLPEALAWAGRRFRLLVVSGLAAAVAAPFLGEPLVAFVAGPAFRPAGALLFPLAVALVAHAVAAAARALALVLDRPGAALAAAVVQVTMLLGAAALLVPRHGALGGALAVLLATAAHAAVFVAGVRGALPARSRPQAGAW